MIGGDKVVPCLLETPANGRPEPYEHGEISVNFFIFSQNLKINIPHELCLMCAVKSLRSTNFS